MDLESGRARANALEFGYLVAGSGPLALCLHGFPDSAHSVAPFMRGCAPIDIPDDGLYQRGALVADAKEFLSP